MTFRLFEPGDMPGILRLWAEESGWGEITEEQFRKWIYTPFGECLVSVASDESGKILGQQVFMPANIYVDGSIKKACRVLAPILSGEIRANIRRKDHPFYEMHKVCLNAAKVNGYSVVYTYPLHSWTTVMKLLPKAGLPKMEIAEYECWSLPRSKFAAASSHSKWEGVQVNEISEEFDGLWETAREGFSINCGMVRDAERLRWKLGGHSLFASRDKNGKLRGYVAVNKKTGLVVDMLATSRNDMASVLGSVLKDFSSLETKSGKFSFGGFGLMKTETSAALIEDFGFEKTDFKFAFGCYSIDPFVATESILPDNWYKMPDD